jgi:hypothetical protein
MKWRVVGGIIIILLFTAAIWAKAQGNVPNLAFINSSNQLVVASGDGITRWIVTNPGETLKSPLGFSWSPDGHRIFFAVDLGGSTSLRVGDVASQSVIEIGQVSGSLSGGDWTPDGNFVLVASNDTLVLYPTSGGNPQAVFQASGNLSLISSFADNQPNLPSARSLSPDGNYVFFWQSDASLGNYAIYGLNSGTLINVPLVNDANVRQSGLWSDRAPLVAYWGFDGSSVLQVTNAENGQTASLNSGRSAPIEPLAWRPGTSQLVYRDTSNLVRIADVSCLSSGCSGNPLDNGVELLPATASDVQLSSRGDWVYFRDGEQIKAVNLSCTSSGNCLTSAIVFGDRAAQRTWVHVGGTLLAYTAYVQDPTNPNDREVRIVNLTCLSNPTTCQSVVISAQAVGGLVSPDGSYITLDQAGNGLNAVYVPNVQFIYLSGSFGGQLGTGLNFARWQ